MLLTMEDHGIGINYDTKTDTVVILVEGEPSKEFKKADFIQNIYQMINVLESLEQQ